MIPATEDGVEMTIRPLSETQSVDNENNIFLKTSDHLTLDSVGVSSFVNIKLVLESYDDLLTKCIQFEDGQKAVKMSFVHKDADGRILGRVATNERGCIVLRKLKGEYGSLLINDELLKN